MARKTRDQHQRRVDRKVQRDHEREVDRLANELPLLWLRYLDAVKSERQNAGYVDESLPALILGKPVTPSHNKQTRKQMGHDRDEARRNRRQSVVPQEPQGSGDTGSSHKSSAK